MVDFNITVGMLVEDLSELDPDMPIWALTKNEWGEVKPVQADIVQFVNGGVYIGSASMLLDDTNFA